MKEEQKINFSLRLGRLSSGIVIGSFKAHKLRIPSRRRSLFGERRRLMYSGLK